MTKLFYILFIVFLSIGALSANPPEPRTASLSGYVVDSKTKETLIGVSVVVKGPQKGAKAKILSGAYTNKLGFFSIGNIPPGKHVVVLSFIGFDKKTDTLDFTKYNSIRRDFELIPSGVFTDEVFVDASRDVEKREITISKINIPIQQLKEIRMGGEADVFRSLQYLPGVLTSSQISSGLFVRGGSPDQNLVLVDGSTVYNPTHLFGFISTFNSNAVKDVELIKGGFPAEYGGRLSAVLNLTQKNGNREEYEGMASVGLISSKLNVEGPLLNGSFFIGARRTYLELIKSVYDSYFKEEDDFPFPDFNFYDINAKMTQDFGKNDKLFISGFMSADALTLDGFGTMMNLEIGNKLISARWTHIFADNLFSTLNVSGSNYINNLLGNQSGYEFVIDNSITDYTIKGSLEWFTSDRITSKFGFESNYYTFNYIQNFTGDTTTTQNDSTSVTTDMTVNQWTHSLYGQINYNITDLLSLQAGLRTNYWELSDLYTYKLRLAARYQIDENTSVKAALGGYSQNLRLATQPDFTFFDTWLPTDSTVPASSADHYILTLTTRPFDGYHLDVDIYYKKMYYLNELNKTALKGEVVADIFYLGNTESYGFEVFLQKSYGRFTGWIGYALGYIYSQFDDLNNGEIFRPKYDRRHDLKVVTQYQLTDKIDIGAVFVFQSGQSYTGATSRFQTLFPGQSYGRAKIVPSELYGLRLPPSHQLNLSGSYKYKMFGLDSRIILDVYNVYSRRDIWFRYYNTREEVTVVEDVKLLPILPFLSLEVKF